MANLHVTPVDDLIAHEETDECVCGPDVQFMPGGTLTVHHALDGREFSEVTDCDCGCVDG